MKEGEEELCMCPSFNAYTFDRCEEIVGKVIDGDSSGVAGNEIEGDDDFEFALVRQNQDVSAEDCQIQPIYPIFNRDLLENFGDFHENKRLESPDNAADTIQIPLKKLFIEDREERDPQSSSSSEADELESVPSGTYCVWRPKKDVDSSPNWCKKSRSTGSTSRRWKIRHLLKRSNSDGKDSFVFLTPKNREEKKSENSKKPVKAKESVSRGGAPSSPSAHEALYVRNRAIKEGDKKKSYLPYRRDLVGFFANVNGLGKAFPSF